MASMRLLLLAATLAACSYALPRSNRGDFDSFSEYREALVEWVEAVRKERTKGGLFECVFVQFPPPVAAKNTPPPTEAPETTKKPKSTEAMKKPKSTEAMKKPKSTEATETTKTTCKPKSESGSVENGKRDADDVFRECCEKRRDIRESCYKYCTYDTLDWSTVGVC